MEYIVLQFVQYAEMVLLIGYVAYCMHFDSFFAGTTVYIWGAMVNNCIAVILGVWKMYSIPCTLYMLHPVHD